ncbi:hypothetical protein ACNT2N_04280 [Pseudomonas thivervalensis]|uniref:Lipoprotein n=1 Tax=Pseudomonas thivervalensis TaxID=86265 RepID=A0A2Z4ZZ24_9PSED|nr:hypothetical protein [Pseudomonas thivervalensis]AXA58053.1 hypothetical protein CE140_28060 [Pseudomonas thivervalensis]AXA63765.1 hypothetical protein CEQ51_28055 [Pseudomonas thivervalensis]
MKHALRITGFSCLALTTGCADKQPNTFIFTADLPPDFAYRAAVYYVPAPGETCTVETRYNKAPVFNREWRKAYKPDSEIVIHRTRMGCPLVIHRIELEINSAYGKDWSDISQDSANVVIRDALEEQYKGVFSDAGESIFYGQCQWLFRTSGRPRILRKILDCKKTNPQGKLGRGRPFSAYTVDQLPGKTVTMKIRLAREERPYMEDTWVKVPNGWKRCMGENFEDSYAFCFGNYQDFSAFQMPDGRKCTIYPGCTE